MLARGVSSLGRRLVGWGWVLCGLVLCGLALGSAEALALDCQRASRPIEDLICSDAELLRLDAALDEALAGRQAAASEADRAKFVAEERAWSDESLARCRIPALGDPLSWPQQWQAAPCLAELYRERLAHVGRPQPPLVVPAFSKEASFIHPLCVDLVVGSMNNLDGEGTPEAVSVPLAACNQGHRHVPVEKSADGYLAADGASDGFRTRVSYRIIGTLKDGRQLAQVNSSSGGSGVVSEIDELQRTSAQGETMLSGRILLEGGEGCNGGIAGAEVIDGRLLQVDYNATAMDFLAASADDFPVDAYDGAIDTCVNCCFATLRYRQDPASGDETFVGATVKEIRGAAAGGGGTQPAATNSVQACFEKRVRQAAGQLPHTFSGQELKGLADDVRQNCPLAARP